MNLSVDDLQHDKFDLVKFMDTLPVISNMMDKFQIYGILFYLKEVIDKKIAGDIVELGCNVGTTSIFIKKFLNIYAPERNFHVYDSWEGLPPKVLQDKSLRSDVQQFYKGFCKTSKDVFLEAFRYFNLNPPIIHSGWFNKIPDSEYPEKICFAFYDGDFYTSITDSLNKTFHKIQSGGVIIIDDITSERNASLPGCEQAVIDFLKDKEMSYDYGAYPDGNFNFGKSNGGAKIVKL